MRNPIVARIAAMLLAVAGLSACGGGGDGGSTAAATATGAAVTLSGTSGDASKYIGTWVSNCGTLIGSSGSLSNVFSFTAVSGSSVSGTLTVSSYTSSNCTGTATPTSTSIVLAFNSTVAVTSSGTPASPAQRTG